jgi:hypothetical protein
MAAFLMPRSGGPAAFASGGGASVGNTTGLAAVALAVAIGPNESKIHAKRVEAPIRRPDFRWVQPDISKSTAGAMGPGTPGCHGISTELGRFVNRGVSKI